MRKQTTANARRTILALVILVAVVIACVCASAYTLLRIDKMAAETAAKNTAVQTAADMAECLAASDDATAFSELLKQNYQHVRTTDNSRFVVKKAGIRYVLTLDTAPRPAGTMLILNVTARKNHKTIYTLMTKHHAKTH